MKSLTVSAEIAGTVWKIEVAVGDTVQPEQDLVILESMKMEIPATSAHGGVVRRICVSQGDAVVEGQVLLIIDGD